jgi:hypothetical protein
MKAYGRQAAAVILCGWVLSGCVLLVGAGAGAGAYSYANGELTRTYAVPYRQALDACTTLLQDLNMPIKEQTSDGTRTTITTERKDGTPMTVKVGIVGVDLTEVSVRTGLVGYWDRDLSMQFQEFLARRLQP